jgi:hypothetical protein
MSARRGPQPGPYPCGLPAGATAWEIGQLDEVLAEVEAEDDDDAD